MVAMYEIGQASSEELITHEPHMMQCFFWAMILLNLEVLRNVAGTYVIYEVSTELINSQGDHQK